MQFKEGTPLFAYEVIREGGEDVLYINYLGAPFVPSLADSGEVMGRTIDILIENQNISRIVFVQQKNYNYDFDETSLLLEIAQLYVHLVSQERILSQEKLITHSQEFFSKRYNDLFSFLFLLKQDPIAAFAEIKRLVIEAKILLEKLQGGSKADQANYIGLLEKIFELVRNLRMIQEVLPFLDGHKKGNREIYHRIFKPDVIPN
ncbi:MAG: hypothetical protein ACE5ES_05615, partial [Candidatus Nanoarchaeia archaeon]